MLLALGACNSGSDNDASDDTTSVNTTGVQNVNGNVPDTTNSITLDADDTGTNNQSNTPR